MNFFMQVFFTFVVCYLSLILIQFLFTVAFIRVVLQEPKAWYADEIQQAERIRQEIEQVESWKRFQTESSDAIEKG